MNLRLEDVDQPSEHAASARVLCAALARLADGERQAFDEVHARARPLIERFVRQALSHGPGDWDSDGDEIVQRTLITLFEQCHRYDQRRDAGTWIVTLAAFEVRSSRRDRLRRQARFTGPDETTVDPHTSPEDQAAARELMTAAEVALGELSDIDRATLLDSLSSSGDGAKSATIRKRLERATRRLFGLVRGHGYEQP